MFQFLLAPFATYSVGERFFVLLIVFSNISDSSNKSNYANGAFPGGRLAYSGLHAPPDAINNGNHFSQPCLAAVGSPDFALHAYSLKPVRAMPDPTVCYMLHAPHTMFPD